MALNGPGVASVSIGAVLLYSGIKGYSILKAVQNIVQGHPANAGQTTTLLASAGSSGSSGGGSGSAPAPSGPGQTAAFVSLLAAIGAPPTSANRDSMNHWYAHEEPTWPPPCKNNPLNTTLVMGGSSQCPLVTSAPVQAYPSLVTGITANARTLLNGYPTIVSLLRSGKGLCGQSANGEFSKWSGGGYDTVC